MIFRPLEAIGALKLYFIFNFFIFIFLKGEIGPNWVSHCAIQENSHVPHLLCICCSTAYRMQFFHREMVRWEGCIYSPTFSKIAWIAAGKIGRCKLRVDATNTHHAKEGDHPRLG